MYILLLDINEIIIYIFNKREKNFFYFVKNLNFYIILYLIGES